MRRSFVLCFDLRLLLFDLCLLFFERVDEDRAQAIVLDAFDFTFFVMSDQQWFDRRHVFRAKTEVERLIVFPLEGDWLESLDEVQTTGERMQVCL